MRHLAALLLVGLFSAMSVLSCTRSTDSSASHQPPVPPSDPLQTCIDAWGHISRLCAWDYEQGPKLCADHLKNAGPKCRDLFGLRWACVLSGLSGLESTPDALICPGSYHLAYSRCTDERIAEEDCVREHGCILPYACWQGVVYPNATGCDCQKACRGKAYRVDCEANGAVWSCDCYENPDSSNPDSAFVWIGTCDGEPFCDYNVDLSCCNQFFMLPY